jgi:ankyrin repeat protein
MRMQKSIVLLFLAFSIFLPIRLPSQAQANPDIMLEEAAQAGDMAKVQKALQQGADIDHKSDLGGDTALTYAARYGHIDIVRLLLDKGAKIDAKNNYGQTALAQSAEHGNIEIVRLLLEKGASIEAGDKYGKTPLGESVEKAHFDVARALLDKGAKGKDSLLLSLAGGFVFSGIETEGVKFLLANGADIDARDEHSNTPLILAVEGNKVEIVKVLLERGAAIDARDEHGHTPLIRAVDLNNNIEVAKLLLERGADVNIQDEFGRTAIMIAVEESNLASVKLLLAGGANLSIVNAIGRTPLRIATEEREDIDRHAKYDKEDKYWADTIAKLPDAIEIERLLNEAAAQNPSVMFSNALAKFRSGRSDEDRLAVIRASLLLAEPPAVPEEARRLLIQAETQIKGAKDPHALFLPIEKLEKASELAPWWSNACYDLAIAYELGEMYDRAVKQLNLYLEMGPSMADARAARDRISVIQAKKQMAGINVREAERTRALRYVGGGAQRVKGGGGSDESPSWWWPKGRDGVGRLYLYWVLDEAPFYANVFRMPDGRLLLINLVAHGTASGGYAGDSISVVDATEESCIQGRNQVAFGEEIDMEPCGAGHRYSISVTSQPNATVTVTELSTGANVTLPVAVLYRGRALRASSWYGHPRNDGGVYQGGEKLMILYFDDNNVINSASDPNVNPLSLVPTRVVPYTPDR